MIYTNRPDAKKAGSLTYFTGEPCPKGHITERSTRSAHCVECNRQRVRKWRTDYPEKKRIRSREDQRRRRATPEGRARLAEIATRSRRKLNGIPTAPYSAPQWCELCKLPKKLVIDHDHITGAFRGWLCSSCNRGLGLLGDTPARVSAALGYLTLK